MIMIIFIIYYYYHDYCININILCYCCLLFWPVVLLYYCYFVHAEILVVVDAVRSHGGVLHQGIPDVEDPYQARRQDVAYRVSKAFHFLFFLFVCFVSLCYFLFFIFSSVTESKSTESLTKVSEANKVRNSAEPNRDMIP